MRISIPGNLGSTGDQSRIKCPRSFDQRRGRSQRRTYEVKTSWRYTKQRLSATAIWGPFLLLSGKDTVTVSLFTVSVKIPKL